MSITIEQYHALTPGTEIRLDRDLLPWVKTDDGRLRCEGTFLPASQIEDTLRSHPGAEVVGTPTTDSSPTGTPSVGDVLTREEMDALPAGARAVSTTAYGTGMWTKQEDGQWLSRGGGRSGTDDLSYRECVWTLESLPEAPEHPAVALLRRLVDQGNLGADSCRDELVALGIVEPPLVRVRVTLEVDVRHGDFDAVDEAADWARDVLADDISAGEMDRVVEIHSSVGLGPPPF